MYVILKPPRNTYFEAAFFMYNTQGHNMLRGFTILRKDKGQNFSLKLFEHNHRRYTVVLKVSLWKVTVYKKVYAYTDLQLAERIYERILDSKIRQETLLSRAA